MVPNRLFPCLQQRDIPLCPLSPSSVSPFPVEQESLLMLPSPLDLSIKAQVRGGGRVLLVVWPCSGRRGWQHVPMFMICYGCSIQHPDPFVYLIVTYHSRAIVWLARTAPTYLEHCTPYTTCTPTELMCISAACNYGNIKDSSSTEKIEACRLGGTELQGCGHPCEPRAEQAPGDGHHAAAWPLTRPCQPAQRNVRRALAYPSGVHLLHRGCGFGGTGSCQMSCYETVSRGMTVHQMTWDLVWGHVWRAHPTTLQEMLNFLSISSQGCGQHRKLLASS
jgi:hypothetical protein